MRVVPVRPRSLAVGLLVLTLATPALAYIPPADYLVRRLVGKMMRITSLRAEFRTTLYALEFPEEGVQVRETLRLRYPARMRLDRVWPDGRRQVWLWRDQHRWELFADGRIEKTRDTEAMFHHFFVSRRKDKIKVGFGGEEHLAELEQWQKDEEERKQAIEEHKEWCKTHRYECWKKRQERKDEPELEPDELPELNPRFWLKVKRWGVDLEQRTEEEITVWHHVLRTKLEQMKVDLGVTSLGRLGGSIAYVLGAYPWEDERAQVWIDKEKYLPLRWVSDGGDYQLRMAEYGAPGVSPIFPRVVEERRDGILVRRGEVDELVLNGRMPWRLFEPDEAVQALMEDQARLLDPEESLVGGDSTEGGELSDDDLLEQEEGGLPADLFTDE